MALQQLQGLTPLGGSSGYGQGRPPNGDGTDPNDPNAQKQQRRPQQAPSSSPGQAPGQAPTFSDLAAQGRARPAPPPPPQAPQAPQAPVTPDNLATQANGAASQALANPSAYGAPQVQQSMNLLNQQLATQATLGRRQIDETMASRGLYDSTAAGDKYGQLQAQQDQARAGYATQLATQAAQSYGTDRTNAINAAGNLQNAQTAQQLQAQQQAQNYALGQGQLGVAQGQLGLGQQQVTNQASQFGQTMGLSQQQLALQQALGYGNLGVAQQGANTAQQSVNDQMTLGQQGLAQQGAYQSAQIGLGQNQINASELNQQRQSMGNLAYAGLLNGTAPSQDWLNFLMGNQGQGASPYVPPPTNTGPGGQLPPGGGGGIHFPGSTTYNSAPGTMSSQVLNATGYGSLGGTSSMPTLQFPGGSTGSGGTPTAGGYQMGQTPAFGNTAGTPASGAPNGASSGVPATEPMLQGLNVAHPNDTPQQTFGRNTTANPFTGAGPLASGTGISASGTDPMSLYAQGKLSYSDMQQQVNAANATQQGYAYQGDQLGTVSDDQLKQSITSQYQSLLNANHGNASAAAQAFLNPAGGSVDPRVAAMFRSMGLGQ